MAEVLVDTKLKAAKPRDKPYYLSDARSKNLSVVVRPSGTKTFVWKGRVNGKTDSIKLGEYGPHSLADAREWADRITAERDMGVNLREKMKQARLDKVAEEIDEKRTVRAAFEVYMKFDGSKGKDGGKDKRSKFERFVFPVIGDRHIASITTRELGAIIADFHSKYPNGGGAGRLHAAIARMWKWLAGHPTGVELTGGITNVMASMMKPQSQNPPKSSFLSDRAIGWLFDALELEAIHWRAVYKVLLLTGARRNEIANLRKSQVKEYDDGSWYIELRSEDAKNQSYHVIPLSPAAKEQLELARVASGNSRYFFPANGNPASKNPISGFTKMHERIFWNMYIIALSENPDEHWDEILPYWTLHDFRRTMRTFMSRKVNNISKHVAEAIISHSGGKTKLDATYDLYDYYEDKLEALIKWAGRVELLTRPDPAAQTADASS